MKEKITTRSVDCQTEIIAIVLEQDLPGGGELQNRGISPLIRQVHAIDPRGGECGATAVERVV